MPELVFWHIPSVAYTQAGPGEQKPIPAPCVGNLNDEGIAPQAAEAGIMNALATRKSVKVLAIHHTLEQKPQSHNISVEFGASHKRRKKKKLGMMLII